MHPPSVAGLLAPQRAAAVEAARALARVGRRAWIVGGAVRDLALGRTPKDVDLATDALPEEVEACFARSIPVGKAFGTIVVPLEVEHAGQRERLELQVTTLRSERGYSDARRPDAVRFGTSLEEDAARRDFTCNALYLDPLSDALSDPCGGLADLRAGRLRAVGDPTQRFREDGLRLLRLARFAAALALEIDGETWLGALAALDALAGVSRERILSELELIAERPGPARAVALLADAGVLERILPGLIASWSKPEQASEAGAPGAALAARVRQLEALGDAPGRERFLALLFAPASAEGRAGALERLESLRPARELVAAVRALWDASAELEALAGEPDLGRPDWRLRARLVRLGRSSAYPGALRLLRAAYGGEALLEGLLRVEAIVDGLEPAERDPAPFLTSDDLAAAGVPRGPRWGELLREAEERRLGGADASREDALRWLRARALAP